MVETVRRFREQQPVVGVVVVDNGSRPEVVAELRGLRPEVTLIEQGHNTGFGPAANAGLRWWLDHSDAGLLVVAPHDAIPAPGCLAEMAEVFRRQPLVGLASADVGDAATPLVDPYFGPITVPARTSSGFESADYPHGTLLMARRSCLLDVGLFDERYFAYCEEADLGLRAKHAGWDVGLVRGARVHNPTMRSGSAAVDYLMHRNTLLLLREHSGRYHAFIRFVFAVAELVRGVVRRPRGALLFSPRGRARGLLDFLRGRYGPPPPGYFDRLDARGEPVDD